MREERGSSFLEKWLDMQTGKTVAANSPFPLYPRLLYSSLFMFRPLPCAQLLRFRSHATFFPRRFFFLSSSPSSSRL